MLSALNITSDNKKSKKKDCIQFNFLHFFLIFFDFFGKLVKLADKITEGTDIGSFSGKFFSVSAQLFFESVAAVVGKAFFVADFYHFIASSILHYLFKAVGYFAYE